MSRLVGFSCTDENLKSTALAALEEEASLDDTSKSSGVGLGWVQRGRSLLRANPRPSGSSPIHALLADLPSRAVIGFVRDPDLPKVGATGLQPFRFREWIYAHDGETPENADSRAQLLESVPGFIRSNIKGRDPAEVLFHHLLGQLHKVDKLEARPFDAEAAALALAQAVACVRSDGALTNYAALVGSERDVFMVRLGAPLWIRTIVGIEVLEEEPLFAGHRPRTSKYPAFRAMMVVNGERPGEEWQEVPDQCVAWLNDAWELQVQPLEPAE